MDRRISYGVLLGDLVDGMARYKPRADVLSDSGIPRGHFYNVRNVNKRTAAGKPHYTPVEWVRDLTNASGDYRLLRKIAGDCGCVVISPADMDSVDGVDLVSAGRIIRVMGRIVSGLVEQ